MTNLFSTDQDQQPWLARQETINHSQAKEERKLFATNYYSSLLLVCDLGSAAREEDEKDDRVVPLSWTGACKGAWSDSSSSSKSTGNAVVSFLECVNGCDDILPV